VNPVLRADVRYRLGSPKALVLHTIFLVVVALLTFLSLPPELGRLDELRQEGLLLAFLVVSTVLTMYFTSACACGEIGIEGEKSVWDLAASTFPAGTIAAGKVLSSASFAMLQWALAGPFIAVVAGIRGEPLAVFLRAALVGPPSGRRARCTAPNLSQTLRGVLRTGRRCWPWSSARTLFRPRGTRSVRSGRWRSWYERERGRSCGWSRAPTRSPLSSASAWSGAE